MAPASVPPIMYDLPLRDLQEIEPIQSPPVSTQSLIGLLAGKLGTGADSITLSKAEAQDITQHLSYSTESEAVRPHFRELVQAKEEFKALKAHCRLSDYAGKVFNELKERWRGPLLPVRADILAQQLRTEDGSATEGEKAKVPGATKAFFGSVSRLPYEAWFERKISARTARFAVEAYSARNLACHSESMQPKAAKDWRGLRQSIE
jgi:hypothetical protein